VLLDGLARAARRQGAAEAPHELARLVGIAPDTEPEDDFPFLPVGQIASHLDRPARVQAGSDPAGKVRAMQRGRGAQRTVAPDEFRAVAAQMTRRVIDVEEGNAIGELLAVRVARVERAAARCRLR
jgi:hypothetical protein